MRHSQTRHKLIKSLMTISLLTIAACGNSSNNSADTSSSSSSSSTQYLTASTNTVWNPNAGKPLIESTTVDLLEDLAESADGYKGGTVQIFGNIESVWSKDKNSASVFQAWIFARKVDLVDFNDSTSFTGEMDAITRGVKATIDASQLGPNNFSEGDNFICECKVITSFGGVVSLEAMSLNRN